MASIHVTIVGTESIVLGVKRWATEELGEIKYQPTFLVNGETMVFNLGTRLALLFLRKLYENSTEQTRLDRKYSIFYRITNGQRMTRELPPYDQRMPVSTDRRRGKRVEKSVANRNYRLKQKMLKEALKGDGIV